MRSKWWILGGCSVGAFILLGIALYLIFQRNPTRKPGVRLLDGTEFIVQHASFGTRHEFDEKPSFLSKFIADLPPSVRRLFGDSLRISFVTNEEQLLLWFSRYDPAQQKYIRANGQDFKILDEHGCVFHVRSYGSGGSSPTMIVDNAYVRIFPRRQKEFKLRATFNSENIETRVHNPAVTNPPSWIPEPLPATRKTNGLEFTLTKLKGHFYASGNYFNPSFEVKRDGTNVTQWFEQRVSYSDATGNSGDTLCYQEPAWKVRADFYKNHKASFEENELWRLPSTRFPESGTVAGERQKRSVKGISVDFIALCGAGEFRFSNEVCVASAPWDSSMGGETSSTSSYGGTGNDRRVEVHFRRKHPTVLLRVIGLGQSEELLVRGKDERGEYHEGKFRGSADHLYRYEFEFRNTNALPRTLELELIGRRPITVEYTVVPPKPEKKNQQINSSP